jgi:hypothetical protein
MKEEIVAGGRSEGEQMAHDIADQAIKKSKETGKGIVLAVEDVRDWIANQRRMDRNSPNMESSLKLRKAMRSAGMVEPARDHEGNYRRFAVRGRGTLSFVLATFRIDQDQKWEGISEFYMQTDELVPN